MHTLQLKAMKVCMPAMHELMLSQDGSLLPQKGSSCQLTFDGACKTQLLSAHDRGPQDGVVRAQSTNQCDDHARTSGGSSPSWSSPPAIPPPMPGRPPRPPGAPSAESPVLPPAAESPLSPQELGPADRTWYPRNRLSAVNVATRALCFCAPRFARRQVRYASAAARFAELSMAMSCTRDVNAGQKCARRPCGNMSDR